MISVRELRICFVADEAQCSLASHMALKNGAVAAVAAAAHTRAYK